MCMTLPPDARLGDGHREGRAGLAATWRCSCSCCRAPARRERMNPYTSIWTGVTPGDGPQEFHLVLLDNGRTRVLADEAAGRRCTASAAAPASTSARSTRASAATPTARSTPGRSARSSRRSSQDIKDADTLPFASTLCGACYEVCPVKIDIPRVLLHLRGRAVQKRRARPRRLGQRRGRRHARRRLRARRTQALPPAATPGARRGRACSPATASSRWLPGYFGRWSRTRDLPALPRQTFQEWWEQRGAGERTSGGSA